MTMKYKDVKTIFETDGKYDSKSILNKSDNVVSIDILDVIENGVSSEDLLIMSRKVPILKYKTQVTIHGQFGNVGNHRILGYANLFQNKNKSIGVKYNAIDEEKRKKINSVLKMFGWHYKTNIEFTYTKTANDKEGLKRVIDEMTPLFNKIDTSLIYGHKYMKYGSYMGKIYVWISLHIGAIYLKNLESFIHSIYSPIEIDTKLNELESLSKERHKDWTDKKNEENDIIESFKATPDFKNWEKLNDPIGINPGTYIRWRFNYSERIVKWESIYLYLPNRAKKCRYNTASFNTLAEAMDYEPKEKYSDSIYSGSLKYYKSIS